MSELTSLQLQMMGWMTTGNYKEVAKLAHGSTVEDIVFALGIAFKDGYNEALHVVNHAATEQLKRERKAKV